MKNNLRFENKKFSRGLRSFTLVLAAAVSASSFAVALGAPPKKGGSADLKISAAGDSSQEKTLVQTIVVNEGPATVSKPVLSFEYDADVLELISSQPWHPAICSGSAGSQKCELTELRPGSTTGVRFTFNRRLKTGTTLTTSSVSSTVHDPDLSNNKFSLDVPLYFAVSCDGYAEELSLSPTYRSSNPALVRPSCEKTFTLTSPRTVVFEFNPGPDFRGYLEGTLSSFPINEKIAAFYTEDGPFGVPSRVLTLAAGQWTLTVGARGVDTGTKHAGEVCVDLGRFGGERCWLGADVGAYFPFGSGQFGGRVIDEAATN